MFVRQFTIGKIILNNSISLNIGVVVRNTSTSHIEVMIWSVTGSILSPKKKWSSVYDLISVHLANPDHHNPFSVFSVFVVLRGACLRKKKCVRSEHNARSLCQSAIGCSSWTPTAYTVVHRDPAIRTPGWGGLWHQQRRLFPALHNAHTLFFQLPWMCECALSRWMKKGKSNCATISFRSG